MKKLSIIFLTVFAVSAFLSSCIKNRDGWTDFGQTQPVLELKTGLSGGGGADLINIAGLPNFGNAALSSIPSFFEDTISWYVNLASEYPLDKALTVTIGVQPELITAYNSDTTHLQYELMPDSDYVWSGDVTVTIPAGQRTAYITGLQFNYDKIDPVKNYMLPIGIKSGDGTAISSNMGAIYFHAIGNPIAGAYFQNFHGWNAADSTTPDTYRPSSFDYASTVFAPRDPTHVEVATGYFTQPRYIISFTNIGGVLSNFNVTFDEDDIKYMNDNGVTVAGGPNILIADPATGHYKFQWAASSSSGPRYLTDDFYR